MWSRYASNCVSRTRDSAARKEINGKLQPEVVSVVNVAVYELQRSFAEMKDESCQVTIETLGFPLHPAPLSSALRLLLAGGYLLLLMPRRLLSNYYTCSNYSHWVSVLEGVGAGCSMNVGHGLV